MLERDLAHYRAMLEGVFEQGEATWSEDFLFVLNRNLPREEGYFTFSYSPIWDDLGIVRGIFCSCSETTGRVILERRLRTLRDLGRTVMQAKTGEEACKLTGNTLSENPADVPFAMIYLLDGEVRRVRLAAATGVEPGSAAAPTSIDLDEPDAISAWPLGRVLESAFPELVIHPAAKFGPLPGGPWPEPPEAAFVLPIASTGQLRPIGFLIVGLSPRRVFDSDYAHAGTLETVLAKQNGISADDRAQLETAHRNSLRLLKLVNSLLDFSRIEAGRIRASYEPVDLASLTADLASNFRSAMEAGGLQLVVQCPPLSQPIYVDREMWEKIVLNLLSNAFKFTFEGAVTVGMEERGGHAVLTIRDTGVGIPESELPHLFERFHRVEGTRGRTYEGSGIGLALIQELVRLHGGTVEASSRIGQGSTFVVTLPFGDAHLPQEHIVTRAPKLGSTALHPEAFTGEATMWLSRDRIASSGGDMPTLGADTRPKPRVLIADDNADMRDHLVRILNGAYEITAVADGRSALQAAREQMPDLVLTDVMMPGLDGFGLLRELRADERLREIAVILVSARAGEEARTEGIAAGADDYITKPFNAAELVVRVRTMLDLQRLRRETRDSISALNRELASDLSAMTRLQQLSTRLVQADELTELLGEFLEAAIEITHADKGKTSSYSRTAR